MIFTLESRDNVMLAVMESYFDLNSKQILTEISAMFDTICNVLKSKNIEYRLLKSALIPNEHKKEILLVIDTNITENNWHYQLFSNIIKIFDKGSKNSFLWGNYVGKAENQDFLKEILLEHLELKDNYIHSNQYFMIYINNVSNNLFKKLEDGLKEFKGFVGAINLTYSSILKEYLSFILAGAFIKCGNKILMQHEDDCDPEENYNTLGLPFEENGFIVKSVPNYLYEVFLTYKIERIVSGEDLEDIKFSINSINSDVKGLNNLKINVEGKKLQHLKNKKTNNLKRIELLETTSTNLERVIKAKIKNNYVFNLNYSDEYDICKFNIMLEFSNIHNNELKYYKVVVSFEYNAEKDELRLITMF